MDKVLIVSSKIGNSVGRSQLFLIAAFLPAAAYAQEAHCPNTAAALPSSVALAPPLSPHLPTSRANSTYYTDNSSTEPHSTSPNRNETPYTAPPGRSHRRAFGIFAAVLYIAVLLTPPAIRRASRLRCRATTTYLETCLLYLHT
jgi:hypothetical protein